MELSQNFWCFALQSNGGTDFGNHQGILDSWVYFGGGDPPQSPPSLGKTLTPCLTNNSDQLLEEQVEYDKRLQPRLQR